MRHVRRAASVASVALGFALVHGSASGQTCFADCDRSGGLDILDFVCFQNAFALGDLAKADCDANAVLDVRDFACFQNKFAIGCGTPPALIEAELVGLPLASYPFFDAVDVHNEGAGFSVAIDPTRFPSARGKSGRLYVAANRSWTLGDPITDVRGSFQTFSFTGSAIQTHTVAVTGSAGLSATNGQNIGVQYDIILDLDSSGTLTAGDAVDGRGPAGGCYVIRDLVAPGPYRTSGLIDYAVQSGTVTIGQERQHVIHPADPGSFSGPLPVVIISHGNGHNYTWYDYLQEHLATWGYVTMAHQSDTEAGIEACSKTLLQHTDAFFNQIATLVPDLAGKLDRNRINWIGHSRGGEAVVRALVKLRTGVYVSTAGLTANNIIFTSSIAPTDFLSGGLSNPGATNFHLLYGSADGDVSGGPVNPVGKAFQIYERATGNRSVTYHQGAGHNDYNCCGFLDATGPALIGRDAAFKAAKADYLVLMKWYNENDAFARELFWRQRESIAGISVPANVIEGREYKIAAGPNKLVLDDYANSVPNISALGGPVTLTVSNAVEAQLMDANSEFAWTDADPLNGMTRARVTDATSGLVFDYTGPAQIATVIPLAIKDFSGFTWLSFRACQGTRHPNTVATLGDQTFTVALRDGSGHTSSINIGAYGGGIEEPYQRTGFGVGAGWQNEFETIRIRLTDFLNNGSGLDLANIVSVDLNFGGPSGTASGRIGLDDLELIK